DFILYPKREGVSLPAGDVLLGNRWVLGALGPIQLRDFITVEGLYNKENDFAWMASELKITMDLQEPKFLNFEAGERFPGLPPARDLKLIINGEEHSLPLADDGRCAVSVPLSAGRYEIRVVSPTGAESPSMH